MSDLFFRLALFELAAILIVMGLWAILFGWLERGCALTEDELRAGRDRIIIGAALVGSAVLLFAKN